MENLILKIIDNVYAKSVVNLREIVDKGKNNLVYQITIPGQELIIRLQNRPNQLAIYNKEQVCAEKARTAGVKTPEIFHIGDLGGYAYSIQEYIAGKTGLEVDAALVWHGLGQQAKLLHTIIVPDLQVDYRQKVTSILNSLIFDSTKILKPSQIDGIQKRLTETYEWKFSPQLCHGNLHPSNVIVDSERKIWLIDWETASGNSAPRADLAEIHTWNNGKENIWHFCQGYGLDVEELHGMMRDIQTLVLFRLLEVINRRVKNANNDDWKTDKFIREMQNLLPSLEDFSKDILFGKNL